MREHCTRQHGLVDGKVELSAARVVNVEQSGITFLDIFLVSLEVTRDVEGDGRAARPAQAEYLRVFVVTYEVFPEFEWLLVLLPKPSNDDNHVARLDVRRADPHKLKYIAFLQSIVQVHLLEVRPLKEERPELTKVE